MTTYRAEYEKWLDCPSLSESEWKELHDIRHAEAEISVEYISVVQRPGGIFLRNGIVAQEPGGVPDGPVVV